MRRRIVKWLVVGVLAYVCIGLVISWSAVAWITWQDAKSSQPQPQPPDPSKLFVYDPLPEEDVTAKWKACADAFSAAPKDFTDSESREIQAVLQRLGTAKHSPEPGLFDHFDRERFVGEVESRCAYRPINGGHRLDLTDAYQSKLLNAIGTRYDWLTEGRYTLCKLDLSANSCDALAFVRFDHINGGSYRMRWWFARREIWAPIDFEDLHFGARLSTMVARWEEARRGYLPAWVTKVIDVQNGLAVTRMGRTWEAVEALSELHGRTLPAPFQGHVALLEAEILIGRGTAHDALEYLDQAEQAAPGWPAVLVARAKAYNRLGDRAAAERCVRQYLAQLGPDQEIDEQLVLALRGQQRGDSEIREACRKALDDNPQQPSILTELRKLLPELEKVEYGRRFLAMTVDDNRLGSAADLAIEDGDWSALGALLSATKSRDADKPDWRFSAIRLQIHRGQLADACAAFTKLDRAVGKRDDFRRGFLEAMVRAGKPLDGYRAMPDAKDAFSTLSHLLDDRVCDVSNPKNTAWLRELVAAHRAACPDDPWLRFEEGRVAARAGEFDAADKAFATGMALMLDDNQRDAYRRERIRVRWLAGKGLSAYRDIGLPAETFQQLAELFAYSEKDQQNLADLVAAHKKDHPDDPNLPAWELEVLWARHDYAALVPFAESHRDLFADAILGPDRWDHFARSLVRLKRFDDARREAEQSTVLVKKTIILALIAAAAGDSKQVAAICETYVKDKGEVTYYEALYYDPDLGPILRGEGFAEFRKKYPPPEPPKK